MDGGKFSSLCLLSPLPAAPSAKNFYIRSFARISKFFAVSNVSSLITINIVSLREVCENRLLTEVDEKCEKDVFSKLKTLLRPRSLFLFRVKKTKRESHFFICVRLQKISLVYTPVILKDTTCTMCHLIR